MCIFACVSLRLQGQSPRAILLVLFLLSQFRHEWRERDTSDSFLLPACLMISVPIHFTCLYYIYILSSNPKPNLIKAMEEVAEYC